MDREPNVYDYSTNIERLFKLELNKPMHREKRTENNVKGLDK